MNIKGVKLNDEIERNIQNEKGMYPFIVFFRNYKRQYNTSYKQKKIDNSKNVKECFIPFFYFFTHDSNIIGTENI